MKKKIIGIFPLSNFGGYEFACDEDILYWRINNGENVSNWRIVQLYDKEWNDNLILVDGNIINTKDIIKVCKGL